MLLPLVNVPMIEYTLEWLAMNKVEETYVFCCAHADQLKRYLADSKWARSKGMKVSDTWLILATLGIRCMCGGIARVLLRPGSCRRC